MTQSRGIYESHFFNKDNDLFISKNEALEQKRDYEYGWEQKIIEKENSIKEIEEQIKQIKNEKEMLISRSKNKEQEYKLNYSQLQNNFEMMMKEKDAEIMRLKDSINKVNSETVAISTRYRESHDFIEKQRQSEIQKLQNIFDMTNKEIVSNSNSEQQKKQEELQKIADIKKEIQNLHEEEIELCQQMQNLSQKIHIVQNEIIQQKDYYNFKKRIFHSLERETQEIEEDINCFE